MQLDKLLKIFERFEGHTPQEVLKVMDDVPKPGKRFLLIGSRDEPKPKNQNLYYNNFRLSFARNGDNSFCDSYIDAPLIMSGFIQGSPVYWGILEVGRELAIGMRACFSPVSEYQGFYRGETHSFRKRFDSMDSDIIKGTIADVLGCRERFKAFIDAEGREMDADLSRQRNRINGYIQKARSGESAA